MADDQMKGLFGSDSDEDDRPEQREGSATATLGGSDAAGATERGTADEDLEDDLGDDGDGAERRRSGREAGGSGSDVDDGDGGRMQDGGEAGADDEDDDSMRHTGPPMNLVAPLLPIPAADSIKLLKTTNIVGLEPRPFDPDTYVEEGDMYRDEQGKTRVRLKDTACMRWRKVRRPDGSEVNESNTRIVRWSDGSMQLLMGEEVLDVVQQDVSQRNVYLFSVSPMLIQGQAALTTRLAFQPASLHGKLHQRLTEVVDRRHTKTQKVGRVVGLDNPELDRERREKAEEEKIKHRMQLQKRQDRVMAGYDRPRPSGGGPAIRRPALNARYLEEEDGLEGDDGFIVDDEDDGGRYGGGSRRRDYDEEAEEAAARRLQSAKRQAAPAGGNSSKRRRDEEEDEEEAESDSGGEEAEEEEERTQDRGRKVEKAAGVKARRGVLHSSSDDDG